MPAEITIEELKTFYRDKVNEFADLPKINEHDAFALWTAATELVAAVTTLRKFCHKYGQTQIACLARTYAHRMRLHPLVARLAAGILNSFAVAKNIVGFKGWAN
jgi:hypothetical protein